MTSCAHRVDYGPLLDLINANTKNIVGEVLTLLEAIIPEGKQAEAAKSTVKRIIWQSNRNVKSGIEGLMTNQEEKE